MKHAYAEMISGLKEYINQYYASGDAVVSDPETYAYFKKQISHKAPIKTPTLAVPPQPVIATITPIVPTPIQKALPIPATVDVKPLIKEVETKPQEPIKPAVVEAKPQKFKRELLDNPPIDNFQDLRRLWVEKFPGQALKDSPPSDDFAKTAGKMELQAPDIALLSIASSPRETIFLTHLATAITHRSAPAAVIDAALIENQNQWQELLNNPKVKFVLACHHKLSTLPGLMKFYREDSVNGRHSLGPVPLILMSDLSHYMQEPKLKRTLWQTLCQIL